MNSSMKAMILAVAAVAVGLVAGCGGGGVTGPSSANTSGAPSAPPAGGTSTGATLYDSNCAGCHGALATSSKKGITLARLQSAISGNAGGMSFLSALTVAEQQLIVDALNPTTTPPPPPPSTTVDGAALYGTNCATCHGVLSSSSKKGITLTRLQNAIAGNVGNMGFLSALSTVQQQAIVDALAPTIPPPTPPTTTVDGAALYGTNCASCHGVLASSGKKGITLTRLQNAITGNVGNMGFLSALSTVQQQAIVDALATSTVPTTPPTTPPSTDGVALYSADCASCHGPLATSAKAGATAARIQTAITNGTGGMGSLSTLTSAQVSAIATALATSTAPPSTPPACGSCHAIPPANGKHSKHASKGVACATCHGSGYSTTAVNAATHNNGVKNLTTTIGWNSGSRSCSNSCHGSKSW